MCAQNGQIRREECRFTRMFSHPELVWFTPDSPAKKLRKQFSANVTPSTENLCLQKVHDVQETSPISKHFSGCLSNMQESVWEVDSTFNQITIRRVSAAEINHLKWRHYNETLGHQYIRGQEVNGGNKSRPSNTVDETDSSAETPEVMRTKKRREGGTHSDACLKARVQSVSVSRCFPFKTRSNWVSAPSPETGIMTFILKLHLQLCKSENQDEHQSFFTSEHMWTLKKRISPVFWCLFLLTFVFNAAQCQ